MGVAPANASPNGGGFTTCHSDLAAARMESFFRFRRILKTAKGNGRLTTSCIRRSGSGSYADRSSFITEHTETACGGHGSRTKGRARQVSRAQRSNVIRFFKSDVDERRRGASGLFFVPLPCPAKRISELKLFVSQWLDGICSRIWRDGTCLLIRKMR